MTSSPTDAANPPGLWQLVTAREVVWRALAFAIGVGAVLIAINHGDAIWRGEISGGRWIQMGLTVMVPYCVSTASSVMALRQDR